MANTLTISGEFALAVFDVRVMDQLLIIRRCFRQPDLVHAMLDYLPEPERGLIAPWLADQTLTYVEYSTHQDALQAALDFESTLGLVANFGPFGRIKHNPIYTLTATPEWVAAQAFRPLMPSPLETPDIETADTVEDATTIGTGTTQNPGAVLSVEDGGIA